MFIVLPFLAKDQSTFGVYSVCMSVTIFLGYADFGFMRSGQKFASESIGKNDRNEEMKYIGFSSFILLIFTVIIGLIILFVSFYPNILLKGVSKENDLIIASKLLFILGLFTPVTVFQRIISMIFEIRIENYINQKFFLISNLLTVISVLFFFGNGRYQIINYYLFSQILNLLAVILSFYVAKVRYGYNFLALFQKVKYDRNVYLKCSKLAYSGLYIMLASIIFYELDSIIISKFVGISKVAIFSIGLSISSIFRTFFGILYSPFSVRINYFIANKDYLNLEAFCKNILIQTAPLTLLSTFSFVLISQSFIFSWVGTKYLESVLLSQLLVLTFSFSFFSYTATMLLVATERVKEMYYVVTIQALLYWVLIYFMYSKFGLIVFGFFKLLCVLAVEVYYLFILFSKIDLDFRFLLDKIFRPLILPLIVLGSLMFCFHFIFPFEKSKINLFKICFMALISMLFSIFTLYFTSIDFKSAISKFLQLK